MTALFLKGLAFGFVLAATVGPMWILCLRRTLAFGPLTGFASGMGIALANPPTILAFAAIFAGLGLAASADYGAAALVTLGVFLGSAAWQLVFAASAGALRGRLGPRALRGINVVSALSILGFAAWQFAQLLR